MKKDIMALLRCIYCGCCVKIQRDDQLCCSQCSHVYDFVHDIPIMIKKDISLEKTHEAHYYDEHVDLMPDMMPDMAQNVSYGLGWSLKRPHLYTDIYNYYNNSILKYISKPLKEKMVLNVGCGYGMEAEFFVKKCQARIIGLDISLGSAIASKKRSRKFNYKQHYDAIVGSMEEIPLADKSIDFCLTYSSLHHAEHPDKALKEMARVAKRGIIIAFEPYNSVITRMALLLGIAVKYEAGGNKVWRPTKNQLQQYLRDVGAKKITMCRHFLNTADKIRYGKILGKSIRPYACILESEAILKLQDSLFGSAGNKIFVMAELS